MIYIPRLNPLPFFMSFECFGADNEINFFRHFQGQGAVVFGRYLQVYNHAFAAHIH